MPRLLIAVWIVVLLPLTALHAGIIHVPGDQPTIQAGIDAAVDGDTVLVGPGTYVENIDFLGKAISVTSETGPEFTIIDGNQLGPVVSFTSGEGPGASISGFTLTRGNGWDVGGGGIRCIGSSSVIAGNVITDNVASGEDNIYGGMGGAGISLRNSSAVIRDNTISNNALVVAAPGCGGGGIFMAGLGSVQVSNNTIKNNVVKGEYGSGGGIFVKFSDGPDCIALIQGNTVTGNRCAERGGGIAADITPEVTIVGNTISDNEAVLGGGVCARKDVFDNEIRHNVADYGGGCHFYNGRKFQGNHVHHNYASIKGGGLYVYKPEKCSHNRITDNSTGGQGGGIYGYTFSASDMLVHNNKAVTGGGILIYHDTWGSLTNSTITGNTATEYGGGIALDDALFSRTVTNCIVWGNTAPTDPELSIDGAPPSITYSDIAGGWPGLGNIDADPLLVDGPQGNAYLSQTAAGQAVDSPCVDAGDPDASVTWGVTRTDGHPDTGYFDIGYHYPALGIVAGPGPSLSNPPLVRVIAVGELPFPIREFSAYGSPSYGVNVACGDPDGDLALEIITGPGPGDIYGPYVRGFESDGTPIQDLSFMAYGTRKFGVNVALGDLDGNGRDEIITGAGPGAVFGPHVRAFAYTPGSGVTALPGVNFFAYSTLKWGVNVTVGDIDGDGFDEIVTGAGPGAVFGPHVRGWNVDSGTASAITDMDFIAYGTWQYGVNVCCADVNGDGVDEMITGPGPGAMFGSHVRGWRWDGVETTPLPNFSFFAWPPEETGYGARVGKAADLDFDGRDEFLVTAGPDPDVGSPAGIYRYVDDDIEQILSFDTFPAGWSHGSNATAGWLR